jgi:hypothetical protein
VPQKILVRASDGGGLKDSLEVARGLRDAGYIAEFGLGCEETSGTRWIVDMRGSEGIELIDGASGEKQRVASTIELLELIRKAGHK